eukprot:Hpha_TRINITY_DN1598_c0_g1::TRINITY_DN1598_c0_g1_i1::g.57135::m.57135
MEIRPVASREEFAAVHLKWAAEEGWNPGKHDDQYFTADPPGFLVGTIDGEPVGAISAVSCPGVDGSPPFGFIGFFIVKPEHRRKGLGKEIMAAGLERLSGCGVIGLDGVLQQVRRYEGLGFVCAHRHVRFSFPGAPCSEDPQVVEDVEAERLLAYDAPHHAGRREAFMRGWWCCKEHRRRVIVDESGAIRGYGVVRPCQTLWRIGPLFADSPEYAKRLFDALRAAIPAGETVAIDVPKNNAAGMRLAEDSGGSVLFECERMYKGEAPRLPIERIFGMTTLEIG